MIGQTYKLSAEMGRCSVRYCAVKGVGVGCAVAIEGFWRSDLDLPERDRQSAFSNDSTSCKNGSICGYLTKEIDWVSMIVCLQQRLPSRPLPR